MISRLFFQWGGIIFTAAFLIFTVIPASGASTATILARQYVTNTVHIAGGTYTTPYIISTPNTEYILDGDIMANGTAIAIRASKVVLNLNGKSITYNQTIPGEGVTVDAYNITDIAVINGSIIQGAALSEGDVYGAGNNPVKTKGVQRLQIAGIHAKYGGRDVGGFKLLAYVSIIEDNILEDLWSRGTLKNRNQGVDAVTCASGTGATWNIIRNNTIINARQRGITAFGQDIVYGNTISINSLATNSYGIFGYQTKNVKVYNNQITGRGEHPIGIGFVSTGTNNIEIYNNTIDIQTTKLGDEYGGNAACFNSATPCGNYAVGFRTTWGGNNINFHDNSITIHTDSAYQGTYSPTGQAVVVNGKGRGLMVEVNAGESSRFYNNIITTLDKDGTGKAFGIACTGGNVGDMTFEGNTVTSNILNVALSDEYGACAGYPLFIKNTFVQAGNYPAYRTIAAELNGYWEGTGRFISNEYKGGAAENKLGMNFQYANKNKSIIFGRLMEGLVRDAYGAAMPNIAIKTYYGNNILQTQATTGADGKSLFMVYDYELNNNGGLTQSPVPISVVFRPHVVGLYNSTTSQTLFLSQADSSATAWDAMASSGSHTLGDSAGSITINASGGSFAGSSVDIVAPAVSINSPVGASALSGPVTVSVNASDNVAVTKVELYVDNMLKDTVQAPGPYGFVWNTDMVSNGGYTLLAKAYDAAGNVGQSETVYITVNNPIQDTIAPTVSITTPVNDVSVSAATLISASATDNVGVGRVDFYVNGLLRAAVNTAPYSFCWITTTEVDGPYTIIAKAYDASGNIGQSAVVTVIVDNVAEAAPVEPVYTISDALLALRIFVGSVIPTNKQSVRLDVAPVKNGKSTPDGKIDISDALAIVSDVVGTRKLSL